MRERRARSNSASSWASRPAVHRGCASLSLRRGPLETGGRALVRSRGSGQPTRRGGDSENGLDLAVSLLDGHGVDRVGVTEAHEGEAPRARPPVRLGSGSRPAAARSWASPRGQAAGTRQIGLRRTRADGESTRPRRIGTTSLAVHVENRRVRSWVPAASLLRTVVRSRRASSSLRPIFLKGISPDDGMARRLSQ